MPIAAIIFVILIAFALGYLARGSHINQEAEDYISELHARLSVAISRDENGIRADVTNVVKELDAIVHRAL